MAAPLVTFCPYLPLDRELSFGPWRIGPLSSYSGKWHSAQFKKLAELLIRAHQTHDGGSVKNPALVYHATRGADGKPPRRDILERLHLVLNVSALSSNPHWTPHTSGHEVLTAENAEIVVWPIGPSGSIALQRGAIVRITTGGYNLNKSFAVPPPTDLHIPTIPPALDDSELHREFWKFLASKRDEAERVRTAVFWLTKSWRNAKSVDVGDRAIFIKTAFETLLDESGSKRDAAKKLRRLFADAYRGAASWETKELLWQPHEKKRINWRDPRWDARRPAVKVTPLEHWFLDFAEQRNLLIHQGKLSSLMYKRKTRYNGWHFATATRVLLEAIRTLAGLQCGRRLALSPWQRDMGNTLAHVAKLLGQ